MSRAPGEIAARLRGYFDGHGLPGIVSAYLFGAYAEGRQHRESDVDVAVLLDWQVHASAADRFDARVRLGSDLIGALHENAVDVVILNDAPPLFGRRIVTRGVRVYCSDTELDRAHVRDVQLRAADLEPFLRRMRRVKLEALSR